ncbi:hypothetical protein Tco_0506482 [Tanacetum coccineum]
METKDTLSLCSDYDEQEIQQPQKQAKILKESFLNKFNALKTTTQHFERQNFTNCPSFKRAFSRLFHIDVRTFKYELSQNMNNLEKQLNNEILHEKDSKSSLTRQDFKDCTQMEAKSFKDLIIQHMESIEQCIVERARHEQEMHNRMKRLNERKLQIQECMVQKDKASDASSGEKDCSRIISDKGNDQGLENQSNTYGDESSRSGNECNDKSTSGDDTNIRPTYDTEPMVEVPYTAEYNVFAVDTQHYEQPESTSNTCLVKKDDSNVTPASPDMCDNDIQIDQNAEDERAALANLITNLKLDVDQNKKIQKQLKKANASLAHELKKCKSILAETSKTLGESNSIRDSCLIAFQNKQTAFERTIEIQITSSDGDIGPMAQLLEAPTAGYEDAIVVPEITADNFELKHGLLNLVQNKQFFGHDKEDPHAHIRYFNKITSTMKFSEPSRIWLKALLLDKKNQSPAPTPVKAVVGSCDIAGIASAVILNKLPKKLGDPGRFLIPCEFSGINTCNALADLGASINLMPYSVWKNLSLPELTPTCNDVVLADRINLLKQSYR